MPLRVEVLFFASSRDAVGGRSLELEVPAETSVAALLEVLVQRHPALKGISGHVQVAVNQAYVHRQHALAEGDEVALIPPVSGGGDDPRFRVVETPLLPQSLHDLVRTADDGAVVTFAGVVREHTGAQCTAHLVYEAYAPMAIRKMAEIAARAQAHWPVGHIAVHHRVGRLEIGEVSILASVASPHRDAAFEACRYLIDRLKDEVPVWKKEVGPDGQYWVEGPRMAAAP